MKKLVKLAVATAVVFGTSALAGDNESSAIVETDSSTCSLVIELENDGQNSFLSFAGTSVHVVENKNMTKSVCQFGDLPGIFYRIFGESKTTVSACSISGEEISPVQTNKSEFKVPTYADHDENGTMATLECTFKTKDIIEP